MSQGFTCPHCSNVIHQGYGHQPGAPVQCMNCGQPSLPPASPGGPLDQFPPQQQQYAPQQQHAPQQYAPQQYAPQQGYAPQQPGPSYGGQPQPNYSPAAVAGSTFLGRLGTRLMVRMAIGVCALIIFGVGSVSLVVCGGIMSLLSPSDVDVAEASPAPVSTTPTPGAAPAPASTGGPATSTLVGAPIASPGASIFGPSVPFGQELVTEPSDSALKYKWKETQQRFRANVKYQLTLGSRELRWTGTTVYTPTSKSPMAPTGGAGLPGFGDGERQGNGTGFVVRPDGYIATCAHVVEDANEIIAVLEGREYPAKVIAVDNDADVAIVRINATGLPHLPILDSSKVRLAEDVRVFGYPLADRLGESIKITRGTVSGITGDQSAKVFQLDVTVNPGNSGGPLVNDRGQVAGVVTALLSGASISEVSFAAGPGSLQKLMDKAGLKFERAAGGTVLPGPELAAKVTKSVALLKVKAGGDTGSADRVVLDFQSSWSEHLRTNGLITSAGMELQREKGSIVAGANGEVVSSNAEFNVLRSLGMASLIALEPLPAGKDKEWQVTEMVVIPEKKTTTLPGDSRLSPYGRRRPPYLPWDRSPRTTTTTTKLHPSVQVRHYQILKTEGDLVHIKKIVKLSTFDPERRGKTPYMRVDGQGVFKFNKAKGLPESLDYSGTVYINKSDGLLTIPFKISYDIAGEQAIAASEADLKRRVAESQAKAKKLEEERKANAIPVAKGLDKLDLAP